jgi:predicted  nucleic acid-binding Zn-ribbon protein
MPRQKTEAAAYLDLYKLVNEKTRLQKEFQALEERRDRIQSRLAVLDVEIDALEKSAHQLRDAAPVEPAAIASTKAPASNDLNTLVLEY